METAQAIEPAASEGDGLISAEDLEILKQNRLLRRSLITALAGDGKVPDDKADKTLLVQLLNGTDAEILGRARLKVAAKTEEGITNLSGLVGKALLNFQVEPIVRKPRGSVSLPDSVKLTNVVPGEMDVGVIPVTLDELRPKAPE